MSVNHNRAQLSELTGREYTIKYKRSIYSYCYICSKRAGSYYYYCNPSTMGAKRHGSGRVIENHKARSYRTWKYNRKTKWKE